MAEATVAHVLATIARTNELADAHDREHRHAAIAIHRDTLPELAEAARKAASGGMDPHPAKTPDLTRRY